MQTDTTSLEALAQSNKSSYKVFQVSTHGHDRAVQANVLLPRWKQFAERGIKHRDNVRIGPGESYDFPVMEGPGCIVNIWVTFTPFAIIEMLKYHKPWTARKKLWIQIFFDNEQEPSVNSPIGDFFGVGFGEYKEYESKYLEERSGGYICRFPMPFVRRALVRIKNTDSSRTCGAFYGAVTYRKYESSFDEEPFYFHAIYREEMPTTSSIPYKILDVNGNGFYVGVVLNIENAKRGYGLTFLEGNTKFFVDGEGTPSIEYTGTEDLFQGAWYYISGEYSAPYSGLTVRSLAKLGPVRTLLLGIGLINKTSQYRFHEHDAVPFKEQILVFIHHGEFDEVPTLESSVAYFYVRHLEKQNIMPLQKSEFVDEYYQK